MASFFFNKGKATFWRKLKAFPDVLKAFVEIGENPFRAITLNCETLKLLERFVIIVYYSGSNAEDVNRCRLELFAKKNQDLNNCPPTKDALLQHIKRAVYKAGKLYSCVDLYKPLPQNPINPNLFVACLSFLHSSVLSNYYDQQVNLNHIHTRPRVFSADYSAFVLTFS